METHRLIMPADLNQYGFLFGGRLLAWIDEASWIAASVEHPACRFVTVAMDQVEFRHSVHEGTILRIASQLVRRGSSSVTYAVKVTDHSRQHLEIFHTHITFVNVDMGGGKLPIPELP